MVELTDQPIDAAHWSNFVRRNHCGAVLTFEGTVRDLTGTEPTLALEYEAHIPMAKKMLEQVERETREQYPIGEMVLIHRLGYLSVGEVSVVVAVSCPHRDAAFAACRYAIDRLKVLVPIWKKDHAPNGTTEWIHPEEKSRV